MQNLLSSSQHVSFVSLQHSMFGLMLPMFFLPQAADAGELDDFSNNLATDLGPVLALFGDAMTKQYLSESMSFVDFFIFAMAPIGIITAIVSVIRVCGSTALRAFVGRAQEGEGAIEAELCTSTSRDVCELFNKGGITRVLGRPKILEIILVPTKPDREDKTTEIFLFRDYLQGSKNVPTKEWEKVHEKSQPLIVKPPIQRSHARKSASTGISSALRRRFLSRPANPEAGEEHLVEQPIWQNSFAQEESTRLQEPTYSELLANPNLSINVGIVKLPRYYFYVLAVLGFFLQAGVVVIACVLSWKLQLGQSGEPMEFQNARIAIKRDPTPIMFFIGTISLCSGMFWCAYLIGSSTNEDHYRRKKNWKNRSRLYWIQPGKQIVGDQTFDAFAYSESIELLDNYVISTKIGLKKVELRKTHILTFVAIIITLGGYVVQFIALRGMNAYVSLAQLGATIIMSFLRGCLRMQRLRKEDNRLADIPDEIVGHELDWLAFDISNASKTALDQTRLPMCSYNLTGKSKAHICKFWWSYQVHDCDPDRASSYYEKLLRNRVRLAHLTGHQSSYRIGHNFCYQNWQDSQVAVRSKSRALANALCGAVQALIGPPKNTVVVEIYIKSHVEDTNGLVSIVFEEDPALNRWHVDSERLESVLGLWLWSLLHCRGEKKVGNGMDLQPELTPEELEMWVGGHISKYSGQVQLSGMQERLQECCNGLYISVVTSLVRLKPDIGEVTGEEMSGQLRWKNEKISAVATAFAENGLGSFSEGLAYCLQASRGYVEYPKGEVMIYLTIKEAAKFRKAGDWKRAEQLLKWQCLLYAFDKNLVPALIALGELYRYSFSKGQDRKQRIFGYNGVKLISTEYATYGSIPNQGGSISHQMIAEIQEIIYSYTVVAARVADAHHDKEFQYPPNPPEEISSLLNMKDFGLGREEERLNTGEMGKNFVSNLEKGDKTSALYQLCLVTIEDWQHEALPSATRALPLAAKRDWSEIVEALLDLGIFADFENINKRTALSYAAQNGNILTAMTLLNHGAFPDVVDKSGRTPLSFAAENGHGKIVRLLFQMGAVRVDSESFQEKRTPLSFAAEKGNNEIVEILLSNGAAIESKDSRHRTPLLWASEEGHESTVKLLLEQKANIEAIDSSHDTALLRAAGKGHETVVRLLLDKRANFACIGSSRTTPLHKAAQNGYESIVKLLLELKPDIEFSDSQSRTPLLLAAENGHTGIVKLLLDKGAVIDSPDYRDQTPLSKAAEEGHESIVQLLLQNRAVFDSPDSLGHTPLYYAAANGHEDIVKLLLKCGASVNSTDAMGLTPLSRAKIERHEGIVKLLEIALVDQSR